MQINTRYRSDASELMDDFNMESTLLLETLDSIAIINRNLGGNRITLKGVAALIRKIPAEQEISILDVGCGNGDMLRALADFGRKQNRQLQLTGIDANYITVQYARKLSQVYPNIRYYCHDVLKSFFPKTNYDIILCTLLLHHFKEAEIRRLLVTFCQQARIGIVINDLHRSIWAYRLFQLVSLVSGWNKMVKEDGLVSILRGFKKKELHQLSKELNIVRYSLHWKWAFRYQWIINNL